MIGNYNTLPDNLPIPQDDGLSNHLVGLTIPNICLPTTTDYQINLFKLQQPFVLYCYPMTGKPDTPLPIGWNQIPGARGCTPQSCSYRDHYKQLQQLGVKVFGMSVQTIDYQKQMANRLHLPFPIISDENLDFQKALSLPTFVVEDKRLLKRITLIVDKGIIQKVHYPIFPSDSDPLWVIEELKKGIKGNTKNKQQ